MADNARGVHVSPGIYTREISIDYAVRSLGITTLGVAGETLKGPAFQVMDIANWREFQEVFGGTSTEKFKGSQYPKYELPYIAKSYLSESEQLKVVRVLGLSGYWAGKAWVISTSSESGVTMPVAILRSKKTYSNIGGTSGICVESSDEPSDIVTKITLGKYTGNYLPSIGVDYLTKEEKINDKIIKIKLWDTAGQEMYHTLTKNYYKKCDGIIIVFDITNKESFDKIHYWVKQIKESTDSNKKINQVIVGNKIDLENERQITKEEGEKMSSAYSLKYFETSAKENIGINEFMLSIINEIAQDKYDEKKEEETNENITLEKQKEEKANKGCGC